MNEGCWEDLESEEVHSEVLIIEVYIFTHTVHFSC